MKTYRTEGVLRNDVIATTKLVIIGFGSLNSMAANLICRYQFREVVIVDPDVLKVENVERHALPRKHIGQPKALAAMEWLIQDLGIDPSLTRLTVHQGKAEEILHEHLDATLWILGTDKFRVHEEINALAVKHNIPLLIGGVYERGKGGQVMFLPKPAEVCFRCAHIHLTGGEMEVKEAESVNYGVDPTLIDSRDLVAVSALAHAVGTIAAEMANLALGFLNGWARGPQIALHSISEPLDILSFSRGDPLLNDKIVPFVGAQPSIGMVPMFKLKWAAATCTVCLDGGIMRLVPNQSAKCNAHTFSQVSLGDL